MERVAVGIRISGRTRAAYSFHLAHGEWLRYFRHVRLHKAEGTNQSYQKSRFQLARSVVGQDGSLTLCQVGQHNLVIKIYHFSRNQVALMYRFPPNRPIKFFYKPTPRVFYHVTFFSFQIESQFSRHENRERYTDGGSFATRKTLAIFMESQRGKTRNSTSWKTRPEFSGSSLTFPFQRILCQVAVTNSRLRVHATHCNAGIVSSLVSPPVHRKPSHNAKQVIPPPKTFSRGWSCDSLVAEAGEEFLGLLEPLDTRFPLSPLSAPFIFLRLFLLCSRFDCLHFYSLSVWRGAEDKQLGGCCTASPFCDKHATRRDWKRQAGGPRTRRDKARLRARRTKGTGEQAEGR